jgi:transcription antitermination protein NusB
MIRRSRAREVVLQLLFQWDQNPGGVPRAAIEQFAKDRLLDDPELIRYCLTLFDGVVQHKDRIDPLITSTATNWRLSRMMPVDRNVLRLGTYELHFDPNGQPLEVVINEAIELSRRFGSEESPKFVNGVLDKIAQIQTPETSPPITMPVPPAPTLPEEAAEKSASQGSKPTRHNTPPLPGMELIHRLAYHNREKMGFSLAEGDARGLRTSKSTSNWIGSVVWFVEGEGQTPRRYSLLSVFVVDEVGESGDPDLPNAAHGAHGHVFDPPVPLNDVDWFPQLFETMGHFGVCPQTLTDAEVIQALLTIASQDGFHVTE